MAEIEKGLATDSADTEDPYADMRASKPWLECVKEGQKYLQQWQDKCDNIEKHYANLERLSRETGQREMQIFWANLQVLRPSIYARAPVPVVTSRFKDRKPLNRHAAEILERSLVTSFDAEDIHATLKDVRNDLALCARGVPWLRYEEDETGQRACYDHLDRTDFIHNPARKWQEVYIVGRRVYLTRQEMRDRFEAVSGLTYLKAEYRERKDAHDEPLGKAQKAAVWELWDKSKGVVVWVTEGPDTVLDIRPPLFSLDRFFPCPKPAYGTLQPRSLIPVPDFVFYKDQIEEINDLTERIMALSDALRMKGFYAGGHEDVGDAIEAAMKQHDQNAILIPVPNVTGLGGQGIKDAIVWLPVQEAAEVIASLVALRKQLIEDVYQITGLSDIMRGSTDPNETASAQQLKSQYGSVRIREAQEEMVRIARDMTRISGEIMAENFQPQTLLAMSQYDDAPMAEQVQRQIAQIQGRVAQAASDPEMVAQAEQNPQMAEQMLAQAQQQVQELRSTVTMEQVFEFLRNERMRPFVLDIETDSTIQPDENAAKQRASEFLTALGTALGQLSPMVQGQPQTASFAGEVLKFAVAPFRAGRELDASIDELVENMKRISTDPPPDPQVEKAKADAAAKERELQLEERTARSQQSIERQKLALEYAKVGEPPPAELFEDQQVNEQQFAAIVERLDGSEQTIARAFEALVQSQGSVAQALNRLAVTQSAPKRVIRDEDGTPVGVETVTLQ